MAKDKYWVINGGDKISNYLEAVECEMIIKEVK